MADEAAPDKEAGAEEEGGAKKKLPLWVIILIASQVVVVAAAIVVFKMMSSSKPKEEVPTEAQTKVEPEKAKPGEAAKILTGPQYKLEPFVVNLIDDGRGPRYLKVEMIFELEAEDVHAEMDSRISQIRDELLILLSSKRQTDIETTDGKRILKDEIFTRVNKVLVTGRIKRVYFTEFVVQ